MHASSHLLFLLLPSWRINPLLLQVEKTAEATVFDTEVGKSHRASTTTNQALKPNKFDTPSTIGGGGSSRIGAQMPKTSGEVEMQARPMDQRQRRASRGDLDSCSTPPKISDWLVHNPLRYNEVKLNIVRVSLSCFILMWAHASKIEILLRFLQNVNSIRAFSGLISRSLLSFFILVTFLTRWRPRSS